MKLRGCLLLAAASFALAQPASAEESAPVPAGELRVEAPPATGGDLLAGGVALAGIGAAMFATAPICVTAVNAPQQGTCIGTSFLIGAPLLALSAPLLVFGALQHARYADWARRHPAIAGLSLAPSQRGAAFGWAASF